MYLAHTDLCTVPLYTCPESHNIDHNTSLKDSCLYSGFVQGSSDLSGTKLECPLSLGLYIDNLDYFSKDPDIKALFCCLLA
jgi:hypothetical protein